MTTIDASISSDAAILERNIRALARCSPLAAEAILRAEPSPSLEIVPAQTPGEVSGTLDGVWLSSPRRPDAEADQLARSFDPAHVGALVVLGFGLGRHVRAIAERTRHEAFVIVFEPNVSLLRAVLERVDHSAWIERANPLIITDPGDDAALIAGLRGAEAMLAFGVKILEHTPSRSRLGADAARFCEMFNRVLAAARTTVVTTLVQSQATCRNFFINSRAYLENPGISDLSGACAGRPAITVAAGPSLARNIQLLKTPGLRDRCVIIAAQTVLKPLLEIGVRPHFVTSLDFHEISARFYEGLTADDVDGVTLVVEPKANPAIVRAFPGAVRMPSENTLDLLFGDLAGEHSPIRAGATVAHLSYYLARHLGCDPVVLIGQDLGFTDGLYYSDGAAIHNVWACELNPFRSLEMLEWERVARHRTQLRKIPATAGGDIYTDEQMATYLAQFNRDFLQDARRGLTTIDATEGGARKSNSVVMSLADAIAQHAPPGAPTLPDLSPPDATSADRRDVADRAAQRIRDVRKDLVRLASISRKTADLLAKMLEHQDDQRLVNRLIKESHRLRDDAHALQPAFPLVQRLNQLGVFKRVRADRALAHTDGLDELEIQRRRIERDKVNVEWIADASDMMASMLEDALREWSPVEHSRDRDAGCATQSPARARREGSRRNQTMQNVHAAALLIVDPERSSLGAPRDLARPIAGMNALARTLGRLARSSRIRSAVVISPDSDAARAIAGAAPDGLDVDFITAPQNAVIHGSIARARAFSRASWRGGIAGLTVYDELISPKIMRDALAAVGADAALVLGGDWPLVDPALCDAVIERFAEAPDDHRLTFTQAPPGLAGCLLAENLLDDIAPHAGALAATIGGILGYHPARPGADQIGRDRCAAIAPAVRDALARFIADDPACAAVIEHLGDRALDADADEIARAWREARTARPAEPEHVVIELALGKPPHGVWPIWMRHTNPAHRLMHAERAESIIRDALGAHPGAAITFTGVGDPITHPDITRLLRFARELGAAALHLRSPLVADSDAVDAAASLADVISVDLYANSAATYERITGVDRFRRAIEMINRVHERRPGEAAAPWIVPRITRCDETLNEIEAFYDKWLAVLGAASIDPLPAPRPGSRIAPLSLPSVARERIVAAEIVHTPGADAVPGITTSADPFDNLIIEPGAARR